MNEKIQLSRTKVKRKQLIIEVAYQMFLENGITETSVNDIADACNITRRTVYNYFLSKTELLGILMVMVMENVDDDFHVKYDDSQNGISNMKNMLRTNFEAYYNHITDFLFITEVRIYLSYRQEKTTKNEKVYAMHQAFIDEIADIIEKGYLDGSITIDETMSVRDKAKLIYQTLYGYLSVISVGITNINKEKYDKKCKFFENMVIGYLESK